MDKEQLTQLINEGLTQREIGQKLGYSQSNIKYWVAKFEIKPKPKNLAISNCKICGEDDPSAFYYHKDGRQRFRCKKCDNKETIKRFRQYKAEAVAYKGGCCVKCGYNKCLASLDFHHLDPLEKDVNWKKMRNWPLDKIKKELDKCILVCRNCHGEIHYDVDLGA